MKAQNARTWLLVAAISTFPVLAADGLDVKTGAWEVTMTTKTKSVAMPAGVMDNWTPEQKAQMQATLKQLADSPPVTRTDRSCVTDKDIREGVFLQRSAAANCTYTPTASTSKREEMTFECKAGPGLTKGRMVAEVIDSANVKGEMLINVDGLTMETTFRSRWLGPTCADGDK